MHPPKSPAERPTSRLASSRPSLRHTRQRVGFDKPYPNTWESHERPTGARLLQEGLLQAAVVQARLLRAGRVDKRDRQAAADRAAHAAQRRVRFLQQRGAPQRDLQRRRAAVGRRSAPAAPARAKGYMVRVSLP